MRQASAAAAVGGNQDKPPPAAFVYSGPGAGTRSVLSTLHSLRAALLPAVQVASLGEDELLQGGWRRNCLLLVLPGGADLPYCGTLDGRGNALIREYVEEGGAYLGLCAGAYYACTRVAFELGTKLEVAGDRELRFFSGTAAGSVYRGFCYESEAGSVAARLRFRCLDGPAPSSGDNGGVGGSPERSNGSGPSSSGMPRGGRGLSGGDAWLDGARVAAAPWQDAADYVNGGPAFWLPGAQPAAARQQQQPGSLQQEGGAAGWQQAGAQVLASYAERDGAAAALLCRVGSRGGKAVLCGSHPELHPSWLAGEAPAAAQRGGTGGTAMGPAAEGSCGAGGAVFVDDMGGRAAAAAASPAQLAEPSGQVRQLQAALTAAQPQRWRFWRSLLVAAGLQPWMQPPDGGDGSGSPDQCD